VTGISARGRTGYEAAVRCALADARKFATRRDGRDALAQGEAAVALLAFDATVTTGAELPVDGGGSQL